MMNNHFIYLFHITTSFISKENQKNKAQQTLFQDQKTY